jgi:hypothetical protein
LTGPGTLEVERINFQTGSHLDIHLNGTIPGSQYSQLQVTDDVTLAGNLNISLGYVSGNLVITDAVLGGKSDNLQISFDGTRYTIQDTSASPAKLGYDSSVVGATGNGTSTVTVPAAAFAGHIQVNTAMATTR